MADLTEKQKKLADLAAQRAKEKQEVPTQRFRTVLQGLTFGGADELEAFLRSLGSQEYDQALAEIRGGLKQYAEARPYESMGYELGGAAAPAIVASLFSGGAGGAAAGANVLSKYPLIAGAAKVAGTVAPKSLLGAAGVGAAQGALTAFGKGESEADGYVENFADRMSQVVQGGLAGGIGAGAMYAGTPYLMKPVIGVIDAARRKLGDRGAKVVEAEIQRLAQESGLTVDEIVEGVASGKIMAENKTLLDAVRSYRATGGTAATRLKEALDPLTGRPKKKRDWAMGELQSFLSKQEDPNILRAQAASSDEAKILEKQMYDKFKNIDASPEVVDELEVALSKMPEAGQVLNRIFKRRTGQAPFFIAEDGTVAFARTPTAEEAELVRRTINNIASQEFKSSAGTLGEAAAEVEDPLRRALDEYTPGLRETRATASVVRDARDAFREAEKALGKSPDQVEIEFAQVSQKGEEVVKAYRAGVMSALRSKLSTGSRASLMKDLANPETKAGAVLRIVMPQDQLDDVLKAINLAAESQTASNIISGQTITSVTNEQVKRQGSNMGAGDIVSAIRAVGTLDLPELARIAGGIVRKTAPGLTDDQRDRVVKVLVSEDPEFVRNALEDQSQMAVLQQMIERMSSAFEAGAVRAGGVSSGEAIPQLLE